MPTSTLALPGAALARALAAALLCVASNAAKYHLDNLHVDVDAGVPVFVSTDGDRLAIVPIPNGGAPFCPPSRSLIKRDDVIALRVFGNKHKRELVTLTAHDTGWTAAVDSGASLTGRYTVADFPDWKEVAPAAYRHSFTFDGAALAAALARLTPLATDTHSTMRVTTTREGITLRVYGAPAATAEPIAGSWRGRPYKETRGFDARYLIDALKVAGAGPITWEGGRNLSPALIRGADPAGRRCIVMPIYLN